MAMMRRPLDQWLTLRRRYRLIALIAATTVLAGTLIAFVVQWRDRLRDDERPHGRVVAVTGPLSIRVETAETILDVRLAGLNCPPAWQNATETYLAELVAGNAVMLIRPRHGTRIITDAGWLIYTDTGELLNQTLVNQGYATVDSALAHDLAEWFSMLEHWARQKRRGGWADE